jgi:NADPH:quinone reductase-like Zn-dependent oxidoreductase
MTGEHAMKALIFDRYGGPEVLRIADAPEPHPGPGQVRIRTHAASVNPFDAMQRAGFLAEMFAVTFPVIVGADGAGVIDEVGDGVHGVAVGDEVFGIGNSVAAEYAILDDVGAKPSAMSWEEAAAIPVVTESAQRALDMLGVRAGTVLLIEGCAGGVGTAAAQLARSRGATVTGTASMHNHDYLRSLGAVPTTYGPGLAERLHAAGVDQVDAVLDTQGAAVAQLVELVSDPAQVVSTADVAAGRHGARFADLSGGRAADILARVGELYDRHEFRVFIQGVLPIEQAAVAHELIQQGHVRGKIVLTI